MKQTEILLEAGTNELEIIEFFIDEQDQDTGEAIRCYFGVNVAKVLEVIESPALSHQKSAAHPCFLGTIPLRDIVLPVLDLSVWLEMQKVPNEFEVILVTEFNKTIAGFLVSGVTQIHRVTWKDVKPPNSYLSSMKNMCITSMVELEDHFALLLDLEKILTELDPEYGKEVTPETVFAQKQYRALVVDDSTTLRVLVKDRLEEANFLVETRNDGAAAWDYISELKQRGKSEGKRLTDYIDILISDIEMPRLDGYTLTKYIKDDPELNNLPVILFSSLITNELRHRGESVGADDQISKPEFVMLAERAINLIEKDPS